LNEVGFEHVLDGTALLADGGSEIVDADGATVETLDDRQKKLSVHHVESGVIDFEHFQSMLRHIRRDLTIGRDCREVPHAPQEPIGDARCSP
jgi:hypothetical protein